jgi:hypothetical protein
MAPISPELKSDIDKDLTSLNDLIAAANNATRYVSDAGDDLLHFLGNVKADSTYDGINLELATSPKSTFLTGVDSRWPDIKDISRLQGSTTTRKQDLSLIKANFDSAHSSLLAALTVAGRDLQSALSALQTADAKWTAKQPNGSDHVALSSSINQVQTRNRQKEVQVAQINLTQASGALSWMISVNDSIQTSLAKVDLNSDGYKAFEQAQATLRDWQQKMTLVKQAVDRNLTQQGPDPFTMTMAATCDYAFSTTKQTVITLTATDQLPAKTAGAPTDVLSVTVECASPFTVSAGVAFSTISNKQFGIQAVATPPGSTTTTNEFVLTSNSSFHPLPIGMVSARLCEPNEKVSFHLSLGLAGNFKSQSSGGSTAEFLVGPSIALFRTMFFTPGLHIGQQASLGGGFRLGDPVPTSITTPPLQTSYKVGFGFAITFTKP